MKQYFHSVRLDRDKCKGCTNCIKRCPTEAIRVRDGKAQIIDERCIDCGECIRVCPYHAKLALTDSFAEINRYKHKIALPAPCLYGQFKNIQSVDPVLTGLMAIGFDSVLEVARGADIVSAATRQYIGETGHKTPIISSACPTIVRLIQVRFPDLIENILPMESPMEVSGRVAKLEAAKRYGLKPDEIGAFFITPCPAKMTAIKNPVGTRTSSVDGAISILDVYGLLSGQVKKCQQEGNTVGVASGYGVGWATSGGESLALGVEGYLAVDGIQNVIHVLEEVENNKFSDLIFFEGLACNGGCVGGALTFENGFVNKNRIRRISSVLPRPEAFPPDVQKYAEMQLVRQDESIAPHTIMKLDDDFVTAMKKMEQIEQIVQKLPGLDCGSCGSPSCRTLAEDIVRSQATELDCIFILKDRVKRLAQEMVDLASAD